MICLAISAEEPIKYMGALCRCFKKADPEQQEFSSKPVEVKTYSPAAVQAPPAQPTKASFTMKTSYYQETSPST